MSSQSRVIHFAKRQADRVKGLNDPFIQLKPTDDTCLTWHFTIRGPDYSPFEGGVYHGFMNLPDDFPFSPPEVYFLTENGKYPVNTDLFSEESVYLRGQWIPPIALETLVRMIQSTFAQFPTNEDGIGIMPEDEERFMVLAAQSVDYSCPHCGKIIDLLAPHPSLYE